MGRNDLQTMFMTLVNQSVQITGGTAKHWTMTTNDKKKSKKKAKENPLKIE